MLFFSYAVSPFRCNGDTCEFGAVMPHKEACNLVVCTEGVNGCFYIRISFILSSLLLQIISPNFVDECQPTSLKIITIDRLTYQRFSARFADADNIRQLLTKCPLSGGNVVFMGSGVFTIPHATGVIHSAVPSAVLFLPGRSH